MHQFHKFNLKLVKYGKYPSNIIFNIFTLFAVLLSLTSCSTQPNNINTLADGKSSTTAPKTFTLRVGFISSGSKLPIGPEGWAANKGTLIPRLKSLGITEVKFFPFIGGPALNEAFCCRTNNGYQRIYSN